MEEVKKKGSSVDGHKLVMTLIFIAVTAVVFLAIGYVAGKNEVDNQQTALVEDTATTTTTALKSTTATTTTSATADEVRVYKNDIIGFSFEIDDGYIVSEDRTSEFEKPHEISARISKENGSSYIYANIEMTVGNVSSSYTGLTSNDAAIKAWGLEKYDTQEDVVIADKSAKKLVAGDMFGTKNVYVVVDGDKYLKLTHLDSQNDQDNALAKRIISTFKFDI